MRVFIEIVVEPKGRPYWIFIVRLHYWTWPWHFDDNGSRTWGVGPFELQHVRWGQDGAWNRIVD